MYPTQTKEETPSDKGVGKNPELYKLAGGFPFICIMSLVVMPTKSGIGVKFDIIFIGKN
jgi:hypothetical protein